MKLLVNISSIGPRPTGLGSYALRCASALVRALDAELVAAEGVGGLDNVVLRAPASHALGAGKSAALRRWIWSRSQRAFPGRLVYSPTHHALHGGDAQILTIHDLIALRYPKQHPSQYLFFRHGLARELARCSAVFTVSETSRQDIHGTYKFPLERISIVPNGVDRKVFRPAAERHTSEPFLLAVGASFAHKNVAELLRNHACWRDRFRLVIASCRGAQRRLLAREVAAAGLAERVRFVEYAALDELVRLYQTCAAFISPSRWEGFGIPPLEALACGARLIVSDIPAHREVLGAHATYVRLGDRSDWERAFATLDERPRRAASDRNSPLDSFSWERSAQLLVQHLLATEPRLTVRANKPLATKSAAGMKPR